MEGTEKPFLKGTLQHKKVSHLSPRALCLDYSFYISPVYQGFLHLLMNFLPRCFYSKKKRKTHKCHK